MKKKGEPSWSSFSSMVEEHCVVSLATLHTVTPSPLQGIQALNFNTLNYAARVMSCEASGGYPSQPC